MQKEYFSYMSFSYSLQEPENFTSTSLLKLIEYFNGIYSY